MIKMVMLSIGGDVIDEWLALMSCIQLSHVWQRKWDGNSHWLIFRWDHQPLWDWGETDFPVPRMLGDSYICIIIFVAIGYCCHGLHGSLALRFCLDGVQSWWQSALLAKTWIICSKKHGHQSPGKEACYMNMWIYRMEDFFDFFPQH